MLMIIKIRELTNEVNRETGETRIYLEFEHLKPAVIKRANVTKQPANFLNMYKELAGKEVVMNLDRGEYNGREFWRVIDPMPQLFKLQPVAPAKAA